ncbi:hypothetical protein B0H19DRAFT_1071992 [Mycena capillaripes]|nr:hypothetical protein B0H19DRAFT_1071992 [Mycena capillaripes]
MHHSGSMGWVIVVTPKSHGFELSIAEGCSETTGTLRDGFGDLDESLGFDITYNLVVMHSSSSTFCHKDLKALRIITLPLPTLMHILHRVHRQIVSYKLGYSPQRPYPWRWTTPISLSVFLLLASVLAVINVPLSAYELIQESTFRPNDTLPPLPFYNLIPRILQHPTDSFMPHTLTIGDTIKLNRSLFEFTIFSAFDRNANPTQTPSAFSYYNNPFSDGCDVVSTHHRLSHSLLLSRVQIVVGCHNPTSFALSWTGIESRSSQIIQPTTNLAYNDLRNFAYNFNWTDILVLYFFASGTKVLRRQIPPAAAACSSSSRLVAIAKPTHLWFQDRLSLPVAFRQMELDFSCAPPASNPVYKEAPGVGTSIIESLTQIGPESICLAPSTPMADLGTLLENFFQSLYHIVRFELGLVFDNQIYLFPEMYNRSISLVHDPNTVFRSSMSKADFTARWLYMMRSYTQTDRVPILPYLRPVPRLKPRASALTSVFVSTFAMLSVLWTIFNIIVGAFVSSGIENTDTEIEEATDQSELGSHLGRDLENQIVGVELGELNSSEASAYAPDPVPKESLLVMLEHLSANSERMDSSLQRVILSLERHGILEHAEEAGPDVGRKTNPLTR